MTIDIQKARDVLAKWRKEGTSSTDEAWTTSYDPTAYPYSAFARGYEVVEASTPGIARLAIGTAGNPELLDAIDMLLLYCSLAAHSEPIVRQGEAIAAAIIAADERMSA